MYFASRFSISVALGPGRAVFLSGRVFFISGRLVFVIVFIVSPQTLYHMTLLCGPGACQGATGKMQAVSVREEVSADGSGGADGCLFHLVTLLFWMLKS